MRLSVNGGAEKARNAPKFDLRTSLFRTCGVDLTRITAHSKAET